MFYKEEVQNEKNLQGNNVNLVPSLRGRISAEFRKQNCFEKNKNISEKVKIAYLFLT